MLTLNDGRSELWQWDTGRTLTVDADCSQVHFSNKVFGRSIDVDVVDGVAIIPDVLLQTDKDLNVWAFVGTAENGYTKISKTFKVNRRNKPADYVFTPPDQTTLGELVERLGKIEESQDPDAIKNAVDDYLANNPIMVKETDPTVPEWAKYPTKPSYTAAEVGAQPAGNYLTEIEIKPVIEAANSAQALAKQADKKVDTLREVVSKFHSNIVEEAKGDIITLEDASDMELAGLTLYGKTIQNGTPTPESPVELESVGDDGSVAVTVCGKNLCDISKTEIGKAWNGTTNSGRAVINIPIAPGKVHTVSYENNASLNGWYVVTKENASDTTLIRTIGYNAALSFTAALNEKVLCIQFDKTDITLDDISKCNVQLEIGSAKTSYEPYVFGGAATASTPNGLPGIPVSSGGNYTDENGQQWICDEIDLARCKYLQRVKTVQFRTVNDWDFHTNGWLFTSLITDFTLLPPGGVTYMCPNAFCTHFPYKSNRGGIINGTEIGITMWYDSTYNGHRVALCADMTLDEWKTFVDKNEVLLSYPLATPIETDLSDEEIIAYAALHTNYPNTTIYNDAGTGMAVKYVADTKRYIDKKFAELASAIVNNV